MANTIKLFVFLFGKFNLIFSAAAACFSRYQRVLIKSTKNAAKQRRIVPLLLLLFFYARVLQVLPLFIAYFAAFQLYK